MGHDPSENCMRRTVSATCRCLAFLVTVTQLATDAFVATKVMITFLEKAIEANWLKVSIKIKKIKITFLLIHRCHFFLLGILLSSFESRL